MIKENIAFKNLFVTVGTTKFSKLIDTITKKEVLDILQSLGITFVQLQTGKDFPGPKLDPNVEQLCSIRSESGSYTVELEKKITLKYNEYFEDFNNEIEKSDLVISHAGAGTCLEVLHKKKPLLVVINEDLMDNHQMELAEELENQGYLYHCTCNTLVQALKQDFSALKHYSKPEKFVFSRFLDKCIGLSDGK
ncbi:unnamed protein product [Callosobruchus maculatus]|uniref:UDP-N-acetylglucosamine transferase subunit ALG13 n=1 Tax=Callosobruchus maculatus TaxID=64391 RepID=A0A653CLF9_CALMS|nr:unnamed protein product [Callosobruchus maculatus]